MLDEQTSEFHMSALQRDMQRSRLVIVLGIHILRALDHKECDHVLDVKESCIMQATHSGLWRVSRLPVLITSDWVEYPNPDRKVTPSRVKQTFHPILRAC